MLGEGIEKKSADLAKDVEEQTNKMKEAAAAKAKEEPKEEVKEPTDEQVANLKVCTAFWAKIPVKYDATAVSIVVNFRVEVNFKLTIDFWYGQVILQQTYPQRFQSIHATAKHGSQLAASALQVSAKEVSGLRKSSGAGMMDCKRALAACNGDVQAASDYLRKKGLASADKKAGRVASEGAVVSYIHGGRWDVIP